jgi:hypothetical protein
MKTNSSEASTTGARDHARQRGVQREIDRFLRALSSYPDRFAREPHLSFQQHFSSIATADCSICDDERHGPE